jgi:flagellar protein FliS
MKNAYSVYREANVDTADQGRLILIAYDVAIKHCKLAMEKFGDRSLVEERTRNLLKVQDALTELMGALKMDVGKIAHNLYALYEYMIRRLIRANARNESAPVNEVLGYLTQLREAWEQAARNVRQQTSASSNIPMSADQTIAMVG